MEFAIHLGGCGNGRYNDVTIIKKRAAPNNVNHCDLNGYCDAL